MGLFDAFKKKAAPASAPVKAAPVQTKLSEVEADLLMRQGRAAMQLEKWEMAGGDLEKAAKAGNAEAMYWLGKLCENGSYSGFNLQRAMELYLRSAEGGCLQGMQAVADEYRYGETENGEKAVYWYERMVAWREDDEDDDEVEYTERQVDAMYALAVIYTIGCGEVEPDDDKMLYWLEQTAGQGGIWACTTATARRMTRSRTWTRRCTGSPRVPSWKTRNPRWSWATCTERVSA